MAKYLFIASYNNEGAKGLIAGGGSARVAQIEETVKAAGGTLESFHFAFGPGDAYVICDLPDAATAAALSLNVNAGGAASVSTVSLLSADEMDAACKKSISYRPPGA